MSVVRVRSSIVGTIRTYTDIIRLFSISYTNAFEKQTSHSIPHVRQLASSKLFRDVRGIAPNQVHTGFLRVC